MAGSSKVNTDLPAVTRHFYFLLYTFVKYTPIHNLFYLCIQYFFSAKVKNTFNTMINTGRLAFHRGLSAILILLFACNALFAGKFSGTEIQEIPHEELCCLLPNSESGSFIQPPAEHSKIAVAPESNNETEKETEISNMLVTAFTAACALQLFGSTSSSAFSVLPESPLLSSAGVPLFVLYHAWKSFC